MKGWLIPFLLFSPGVWAGGTIGGTVIYQGTPPPPRVLPVTADQEVCGKKVTADDLVIGPKGEIQNVVVSLKGPVFGGKTEAKPTHPLVLDQRVCRFEPHVLLVPAATPLEVTNSDRVLRDFQIQCRLNPPLHRTLGPSPTRMTVRFDLAETIEVRCNVHDWMQAWVVVIDHPYYSLTGAEGRYQLTDVPAGDYTLRLWHESLGTQSRRVHVTEGSETKADFHWSKKR